MFLFNKSLLLSLRFFGAMLRTTFLTKDIVQYRRIAFMNQSFKTFPQE